MASNRSDTEDLELESLRSAVLASLKTKSAAGDKGQESPKAKEEDSDEDEDLRALRLAALKSKKETGSTSQISTPLIGSPHHPSQTATQQPLLPETATITQRGVGASGNLIAIIPVDLAQPKPSAPLPRGAGPRQTVEKEEEAVQEGKSSKFSRFESSGSDSDDDDDLLLDSDSDSSAKSLGSISSGEDNDDDADSWRTRSFSEAESDSASGSDAGSKKDASSRASASDQEEKQDKRESDNAKKDNSTISRLPNERAADQHSNVNKDDKKSEHNVRISTKNEPKDIQRNSEKREGHRQQDLRTRIRGDDRDRRRREKDIDNRRDKDGDRRRERRDNPYTKDVDREKQRAERRREYESRRERRMSPRHSSRGDQKKDRSKDAPVDDAAREARRRKFASGNNVNVKDRTTVRLNENRTENGENVPHDKDGKAKQVTEKPADLKQGTEDAKDNTPAVQSDSDISLSSVESSSSSSSDEEDEQNKSESDSESDHGNENSRFKHASAGESKPAAAAPAQSRLITSMILPTLGGEPMLPGRRPFDRGDRNRERWNRDPRDRERRQQDGRPDREHDRIRRPHLPRHLDRQERGSSRDGPRTDREGATSRHPRDVNADDNLSQDRDSQRQPADAKMNSGNDADQRFRRRQEEGSGERPERLERAGRLDRLERLERLERPERLDRSERSERPEKLERLERPERLDRPERRQRPERLERQGRLERPERFPERQDVSRPVRRKATSAQDFVSESSESENEGAGQALRSFVKVEKPEKKDTERRRFRVWESKPETVTMTDDGGGRKKDIRDADEDGRERRRKETMDAYVDREAKRKLTRDAEDLDDLQEESRVIGDGVGDGEARRKETEKQEKDKKKKEKREKKSKEKKHKRKRDIKERIGARAKEQNDGETRSGDEAAGRENRQVKLSEEDAVQKKRSVLDRLGSAPSPDKARGSIKSRLGPVKKVSQELLTEEDSRSLDQAEDFLPPAPDSPRVGPDGDMAKKRSIEMSDSTSTKRRKIQINDSASGKRRKIEMDDSNSDRSKKRLKLKVKRRHPSPDNVEDGLDADLPNDDMFTVAEPPKRKQLSKSLLSRLSERRPSAQKEVDHLAASPSHESSPEYDIKPKERRVTSRDDQNDDDIGEEIVRKTERRSKNRHVWSSRARTVETNMEDDDGEETLSKDDFQLNTTRTIVTSSKRSAKISERDFKDRDEINDRDEIKSRKKERKTKIKDIWSSKRKAVSKKEADVDRGMSKVMSKVESKVSSKGDSKDEELEERIRKIQAKNAAIMERQREIEEEKKMFGGKR